jgi:hypothetical protein
MSTTITQLRGSTEQTLLSTELNTLANNTLVLGSAITLTDAGYLLADITLVVGFGAAPTVNTSVSVWLLRETDGTNYEDGAAGATGVTTLPARAPDVVFPLRAATGAHTQRVVRQIVLPPGTFKALLLNDGTGQAFAGSGNTLKLKASTFQA